MKSICDFPQILLIYFSLIVFSELKIMSDLRIELGLNYTILL